MPCYSLWTTQKLELNLFRLLSAMSIASSWDQLVLQLLEEEELLRRFYGVPGSRTDADAAGSKQVGTQTTL